MKEEIRHRFALSLKRLWKKHIGAIARDNRATRACACGRAESSPPPAEAFTVLFADRLASVVFSRMPPAGKR